MKEFDEFVAIVHRLRKDCPWDRVQTHDSLRSHIIEEVYEVTDAIENKNLQELKAELGDVLLHVGLQSVIAEEENSFSLSDVINNINEKLIRRHPHIFADERTISAEEQIVKWDKIKISEGRLSVLDGIPNNLPALIKAEKVQKKAAKVGFDWTDKKNVWAKVEEELSEFKDAERGEDIETRKEEFGDLLFALVNYARFLDINAEDALHTTTKKFISRFQYIERRMRESGKDIHSSTLDEMDVYWNEAKKMKSVGN
jgi:MazG family protein